MCSALGDPKRGELVPRFSFCPACGPCPASGLERGDDNGNQNDDQAVKGTRDFYPEAMAFRTWLYGKVRAISERFGYQEYEAPILERLELYAAKSGEELVKEQSFVLTDRGGDELALRPELTPSLARMIAQQPGHPRPGRCAGSPLAPFGATSGPSGGAPASSFSGISTCWAPRPPPPTVRSWPSAPSSCAAWAWPPTRWPSASTAGA